MTHFFWYAQNLKLEALIAFIAITVTLGCNPSDNNRTDVSDDGSSDGGIPAIGTVDKNGRTLVWSEEFNGESINMDIWAVKEGAEALGQTAYATSRPENLSVVDGHLEITARHEDYKHSKYTTSGIATEIAPGKGLAWQYGRIEARMKVPMGQGCWPAFWMMPQNNIYGAGPPSNKFWPRNGEIDIMEATSPKPDHVHGTIHFVENGKHAFLHGSYVYSRSIDDDYHIYSIVWTSDKIVWYFDNKKYFEADAGSSRDGIQPFHQPFFVLINLAVGSAAGDAKLAPDPAVYPQTLCVDWVRIWQ